MAQERGKKSKVKDFPGDPVVKAPGFHCGGHPVPSLVGELRSHVGWHVHKHTHTQRRYGVGRKVLWACMLRPGKLEVEGATRNSLSNFA